jgi:hypothetical protein
MLFYVDGGLMSDACVSWYCTWRLCVRWSKERGARSEEADDQFQNWLCLALFVEGYFARPQETFDTHDGCVTGCFVLRGFILSSQTTVKSPVYLKTYYIFFDADNPPERENY